MSLLVVQHLWRLFQLHSRIELAQEEQERHFAHLSSLALVFMRSWFSLVRSFFLFSFLFLLVFLRGSHLPLNLSHRPRGFGRVS